MALSEAERKVCEALKLNPEYWDISGDNPAARLAVRLQEQLDARSQWVSVEERLPEPHRRVLVWLYLPKNPAASDRVIAEYTGCDKDEPEEYGKFRRTIGCWWASGMYYEKGHVTHWQPLPDPPSGPQPGDKA